VYSYLLFFRDIIKPKVSNQQLYEYPHPLEIEYGISFFHISARGNTFVCKFFPKESVQEYPRFLNDIGTKISL
jgi:MoaA/NifB/PqqE/SkfB family radical SAM enzyme